jgi:hypothetical protein
VTQAQADTPHEFSQRAQYVVVTSGDGIVMDVPSPTKGPWHESRYHLSAVPEPPAAVRVIWKGPFPSQMNVVSAPAEVGATGRGRTVTVVDAQPEPPQVFSHLA